MLKAKRIPLVNLIFVNALIIEATENEIPIIRRILTNKVEIEKKPYSIAQYRIAID
jgi:hypothetical protein